MTHLLVALVLPHAFVLPPKVARVPALSQKCTAVSMNAAMGGGGGECPFTRAKNFLSPRMQQTAEAKANPKPAAYNTNWWPNQLRVDLLSGVSPDKPGFDYNTAFATLDLGAVRKDITEIMTTSQEWWPADYGHYGPFFIRMAWHAAGTYRIFDGRGGGNTGNQRFAPLNSWPDNVNLDKARRLLWPVKAKYGKALSWGDLMIFAGNVALEDMGFEPFGFAGGRADIWEPEADIYWGQEEGWLDDGRHNSGGRDGDKLGESLDAPLGAVQMGLIYVNPEGPGAVPDPLLAAKDIKETFARMAMNDEETVALIAGGHTFGKAHGAGDPGPSVGPEPEGASLEEQGFGWTNTMGTGKGVDTISSGLEGAWTQNPIAWDNGYFDNLFGYEWVQTKSPAGATQWTPKGDGGKGSVPDAHDASRTHAPMMFTTDLALRMDPTYEPIARRFHEDPAAFKDAFARAWYKLTHRDMGPITRCVGAEVPAEPQIWQDPVPAADPKTTIGSRQATELKATLLKAGVDPAELVRVAWASASTYRMTDHRGGANGARIRLAPQKDWEVNDPPALAATLEALEGVQASFNKKGKAQVSMADLIVLGGCAGVEAAAKAAGVKVEVPFTAGRTDATDEMTDHDSFAVLEPTSDGFRNFLGGRALATGAAPESMLIDRAHMLSLSAPEMTVLVGGLRAIGATAGGSSLGVLTKTPGTLNNDFFVNLLSMETSWEKSDNFVHTYDGKTVGGDTVWQGSAVDLVFGSNSQLRALAEYYACDDAKQEFVDDFVAAWVKVMNLDRFDV